MSIFRYKRIIVGEFPNTTTLDFKYNFEIQTDRPTHLAEVDGFQYIFIPDTLVPNIPKQSDEIEFESVTLDPVLKSKIKQNSATVALIDSRFNEKLRAVYSLDDEQYFSRIGTGVALGMYVFQPGEEQSLIDFGKFVENLRTEKRAELSSIDL
jgi:hypothetical protein